MKEYVCGNFYSGVEHTKLYIGDCIEFMKKMPDKSVNLLLTDPPYGVNLKYATLEDTPDNWFKLMKDFIPEAKRIANCVIFPSCQIKRLKWFYENYPPDWLICWYKGATSCASFVGFNDWEPMIVYGKNKKVWMHDYIKTPNTEKMGNYGHPCPKPIEWAKQIIEKATKDDMTVFDPFLGSGTVGVAARMLGRKFIGIDICEKYVETSFNRIRGINEKTNKDSIKV